MTNPTLPLTALIALTSITMLSVPFRAEAEPLELTETRRPDLHERSWHLMLEGVAEAPLFAGGRLELELPGRVRLGTFVGVMPEPSVALVEAVTREVVGEQLGPIESELLRTALERSLVARGFVAWSPFRNRGLYLAAGYSFVSFGGDLTSAEVLARTLGPIDDPIDGLVKLDAALHGIHGEVGYRFFAGPVIFRLSLGFTGTVATSTSLTVDSEVGQRDAQAFADRGAELLGGVLGQHAMMPTLGLGIGYDFGF